MRGGLVGAALWLTQVGVLLTVGFSRIGASASDEEVSLRLGGVGALLAHLVEGQVGIVTAMPLALFWVTAAWVALPWGPRAGAGSGAVAKGPAWRAGAIAAASIVLALTAWGTTQWLLASMAYARGAVSGMAGRTAEAYPAFERSAALAPWLPLPAEAMAQTSLQLAAAETNVGRRARFLGAGEAALEGLRRHALPGAADWALTAQLAFARVRDGDRSRLGTTLDAFSRAADLSPRSPNLLTQWAWALLHAGDSAGAKRVVGQALSAPGGDSDWFTWAVLARACNELGQVTEEEQAKSMARKLAPPAARPALDGFLR
jgi:tetratricopeptide (TPR) repeat protein